MRAPLLVLAAWCALGLVANWSVGGGILPKMLKAFRAAWRQSRAFRLTWLATWGLWGALLALALYVYLKGGQP